MSFSAVEFPEFPAAVIHFGKPGPEVVSPEITMDMRRHKAKSDSMLFYQPDPSDFIASLEQEGRVNIDHELVMNLVNSCKTLGSIMHDMAGIPILDWTHYKGYTAAIPEQFFNRIAIRQPPMLCSIAYANDQFIYKPNMTPQEAVGWFRGIQQLGLSTIAWIKDAAIHIALSDGNTGWYISREHLEQLPRQYDTSADDLWRVIDEILSVKANNSKLDPFDPAIPETWCSRWYNRTSRNVPFILKTVLLARDASLIDTIEEDSTTIYQMNQLPPLNPSDFDTCSTLSSEDDLYRPSPPYRHTQSSHIHIKPSLLEAVVGYAQAKLDAAAEEQSDSEDSIVNDNVSTMGMCQDPDRSQSAT